MQIMPLKSYTYNRQNPSFSSYSTEVYKNGKLLYRTHTELLRLDFSWLNCAKLIMEKYKDVSKVNIVNHACSAGLETLSLLIALKYVMGNDFQKCMPIIARDIDPDAIEYAKKGNLELCSDECFDTRLRFGNVFDDNFNVVRRQRSDKIDAHNEYLATCKTDLIKNIDFACSDIFKDKELINKENTVLLLRNCWPYFGEEKVADLIYFLACNLKQSSLLAIGEYDEEYGIDKLLREYGFKETKVGLLFEAPGKPLKEKTEKVTFVHPSGVSLL